jgi:hypothetical protein
MEIHSKEKAVFFKKEHRAASISSMIDYRLTLLIMVADQDYFWFGYTLLPVPAVCKAAFRYLAYLSNNVGLKSS